MLSVLANYCSLYNRVVKAAADLGILLDSEMSMQWHIGRVISVCFYHLRRLRQIRNYVSQTVMAQLVMSLVITRIFYCNSVLAGLPACTLALMQWVQNMTARLVLNLDRHHTSVLHYNSCTGCRWSIVYFGLVFIVGLFTLRTKLSGAVYCYRSCVLAVAGVGGRCFVWVCYHDNSKLHASIFTKLGL